MCLSGEGGSSAIRRFAQQSRLQQQNQGERRLRLAELKIWTIQTRTLAVPGGHFKALSAEDNPEAVIRFDYGNGNKVRKAAFHPYRNHARNALTTSS